jgi:hypothetical protein
MIGSKSVLIAAAAALLVGCGITGVESSPVDRSNAFPSMHHPSGGPARASEEWPLPGTGEAVVAAMSRMPQTLGTWHRTDAGHGMVFYEHPKGQLGIEGSDLEDIFIEKDVTAEEAVERLAADLDPGTSRSCSRPPYHCVQGESREQPAMLWGHEESDALLVAVWPDDESHDLLAEAWAAAQN